VADRDLNASCTATRSSAASSQSGKTTQRPLTIPRLQSRRSVIWWKMNARRSTFGRCRHRNATASCSRRSTTSSRGGIRLRQRSRSETALARDPFDSGRDVRVGVSKSRVSGVGSRGRQNGRFRGGYRRCLHQVRRSKDPETGATSDHPSSVRDAAGRSDDGDRCTTRATAVTTGVHATVRRFVQLGRGRIGTRALSRPNNQGRRVERCGRCWRD